VGDQYTAQEVVNAAREASASVQQAAEAFKVLATELSLPHVVHRPRVFQDGNQWCAILGDLVDGVAGFGPSPYAACLDFDRAWHRKLNQP
jgi:hypothetical protein